MLENVVVVLMTVFAFGSWALYGIWDHVSDDDGYWPNDPRSRKKDGADKKPERGAA